MEENTFNSQVPQPENKEDFGKQLLDAVIHLLYRFVYFLFILPYGLWKNAVIRLSKQKKENALDVTAVKTEYPFLSWLKRFVFDFLIDGLTVIAWLVGFIVFIIGICKGSLKYMDFGEALTFILGTLYVIYWAPVALAIIRDLLTLFVVMPIRWLISFFRRPAKTYDLTHVGSIKKD